MAVTVDPKTNKLIIRFRVKGYSKQFYISTGLKDTKANRAVAESRWEIIQREIALDEFDPTLDRYRFGSKKIIKNEELPINKKFTLAELWEKFTEFKAQILEATTITEYKFTKQAIFNFPSDIPSEIRKYLLDNYSYSTARRILADLSRCHDWAVQSGLVSENNFKNLTLPKLKKSSREEIAAYTIKQRDLIIYTFEHHSKYSHYSKLIKFLFWTGCRPGEAFALTWGDVNHDCTRITINKSYASKIRLLKGTKNGKKRVFPTGQGSKLQTLLLEMRPNHPDPGDSIFKSKAGRMMTLRILDKVWRGNQSGKYFYPGVVRELADKKKIPYLKLYSTRHTFATWAIASGCSPDKVAYWLGDDIQTVLTYYCHPEVSKADCPDF